MFEFIDIYCERTGPGLLAEPLNAFTNLSFFIAAFFAFALARKENALDWRSSLLIGLTAAMGAGSTLFHTYAQTWAMLTDVLSDCFYRTLFQPHYRLPPPCIGPAAGNIFRGHV
ncbi:MAG TPA: hypothetical protein PLO23_06910 [Alphaproteobacteria bacterium]|nr:hypothetical protein [Alphaproteobacteria bacterium]